MRSSKREIVETSAAETHSVLIEENPQFCRKYGIWIKELADYISQVN
jgi:hypothetical protein